MSALDTSLTSKTTLFLKNWDSFAPKDLRKDGNDPLTLNILFLLSQIGNCFLIRGNSQRTLSGIGFNHSWKLGSQSFLAVLNLHSPQNSQFTISSVRLEQIMGFTLCLKFVGALANRLVQWAFRSNHFEANRGIQLLFESSKHLYGELVWIYFKQSGD